jgi:hypothetical protein
VKTPEQVLVDVRRRMTGNWHNEITSQAATWPHNFPLGAATKPDLETNFGSFQQQVFQ